MSDHLRVPPSSSLGKRKSDDDLGRKSGEDRKAAKEAEAQKKQKWVHKEVRKRSRHYCCQCEKKQGLDKKGDCRLCGHGPDGCSECLAARSLVNG